MAHTVDAPEHMPLQQGCIMPPHGPHLSFMSQPRPVVHVKPEQQP
jgi:hypothetical protein